MQTIIDCVLNSDLKTSKASPAKPH